MARSFVVVALLAFALLGPLVARAQTPPPSGAKKAAIFALHAYIDGEADGFAKLQGNATGSASKNFTYYQSLLDLPGAAACAIYTVKSNGDRFGTCDFDAATQSEVMSLWSVWMKHLADAEPGWKKLNVTNGHHLAQAILSGPNGVRGVYIYIAKNPSGGYRLTTTFGTMQAIER